ncbi:MAG TPA: hypothetical protein VN824_06780, partial [Puia sp.]|nr:hypothetical protein [Puia sp.]
TPAQATTPVTTPIQLTAAAHADAPLPAPLRTVTTPIPVRDTLPNTFRRDSLLKRNAELDDLDRQRYLFDAIKKRLEEEEKLSHKLLMDSLSKLGQIQVDTMSKEQMMLLINNDLKLAIDKQLLNKEIERLAHNHAQIIDDHAQIIDDHAQITDDHAKMANDRLRVPDDKVAGSSDRRIMQIIKNLTEAGLLSPDSKNFSFNLDSERLLVNGKTAPALDFKKLKAKYIHSSKEHFNYKQHGGSVQMDISMDND